jgi:predicted nucleotide-binding protein
VYARIARRAREQALERHLAAISVARDEGINIHRFASPTDLATLRGTVPTTAAAAIPSEPLPARLTRNAQSAARDKRRKKGNAVWVVHGRNEKLRKAVFTFLRATGVQPIEWSKALALTRKPSPYVGEVLEAAFAKAQAVVVLPTPDDEARLKREFQRPRDPAYEKVLTGQARPNVLFEAGMAFGTHPDQTVIVEIGELRPFSDTYGRHVVQLANDAASRQEFMIKLRNAGCQIDFTNTDWQTEGDFTF